MNKFLLSPEEKALLEAQHHEAKDVRESDRLKSILLRSEGWEYELIAQALRIHRNTARRHVKDYIFRKKLKPENGGSESYLNELQTEEIIQHLTQTVYVNSAEIVAYISENYQVNYSKTGIVNWLHNHGFSYKEPKGLPHKSDPILQAEFIEKYQTLKANLPENESILFMDAVHPTQATKTSCGWIRKGINQIIKTTGSRTRMNILGAIELNNISQAVNDEFASIDKTAIIPFLAKIRTKYRHKKCLHIILDGAGYHRSTEVQNAALGMDIILHYLPPYSPNLNPIERLWKVMNEKVRNNRYFATAKQFKSAIKLFFEEILPQIGSTLDNRINDNFQLFKVAT
ncbi:MAG: IS630 family transposase [Enterovibrio sp.]